MISFTSIFFLISKSCLKLKCEILVEFFHAQLGEGIVTILPYVDFIGFYLVHRFLRIIKQFYWNWREEEEVIFEVEVVRCWSEIISHVLWCVFIINLINHWSEFVWEESKDEHDERYRQEETSKWSVVLLLSSCE